MELETLTCGHAYCSGCISQHVQYRLLEDLSRPATCPQCRRPLADVDMDRFAPADYRELQDQDARDRVNLEAEGPASSAVTGCVPWWITVPYVVVTPFAATLLLGVVVVTGVIMTAIQLAILALTFSYNGCRKQGSGLASMVQRLSGRVLGASLWSRP